MDFEVSQPSLPSGPVPLFPLPGVFLFPHQVVPLHIFETRYREMVADLLDGPGRLVLAAPLIGGGASGGASMGTSPGEVPDVVPVAGLGEILRHEKLDDGRYMIWVLGLSRVHLQEVPSDKSYRMVECLPFVETAVPDADAEELAQELRQAATQRLKQELPLPDSTPPGLLADLLMQTLQAPRPILERAFVEPDVTARARLALREAERAPPLEEPEDAAQDQGDEGSAIDDPNDTASAFGLEEMTDWPDGWPDDTSSEAPPEDDGDPDEADPDQADPDQADPDDDHPDDDGSGKKPGGADRG